MYASAKGISLDIPYTAEILHSELFLVVWCAEVRGCTCGSGTLCNDGELSISMGLELDNAFSIEGVIANGGIIGASDVLVNVAVGSLLLCDTASSTGEFMSGSNKDIITGRRLPVSSLVCIIVPNWILYFLRPFCIRTLASPAQNESSIVDPKLI